MFFSLFLSFPARLERRLVNLNIDIMEFLLLSSYSDLQNYIIFGIYVK